MRAALRIDGFVTSGHCHVDCMFGMSDEQLDSNRLEVGWLDREGNFVSEKEPDSVAYLIRHGQSEQNVGLTRAFDSQLTEEGTQQAIRVGKALAGVPGLDGLVSPFLRCLQTAEAISLMTGIRFRVVSDLGEWPGRVDSHRGQFPEMEWPDGDLFESQECDDWEAAIRRVAASVPRRCVLVTHGGVVWGLAGQLTGREIDPRESVPNASLSLIRDGQAEFLFRKLC